MLRQKKLNRRTHTRNDPLESKALSLYAKGDVAGALAVANDTTGGHRPSAALLNLMAVCHWQLHNPKQAISCWQQAMQVDPNCVDACSNMGAFLKEHGHFEASEALFRRAIKLKPDSVSVYYNLGILLQEQNRFEEAEFLFRRAIQIQPDDADAHNVLGVLLWKKQSLVEAEAMFLRAISIRPDLALAHKNLGGLLQEQNRLDEAESAYQRALAIDPTLSALPYLLSALRGENCPRAPTDYVRDLFDGYASHFEQDLVQRLQYEMPKILRQVVEEGTNGALFFPRSVDMGCGSGLLGPEFRSVTGHLLGIDLSEKMLALAEKKALYDQLFLGEIEAVLQEMAVGIDLFLAADVFIYFGALHTLFQTVSSKAAPGALFAFSVEHLERGHYTLQTTGRYAHSREYIQALADANHFSIILFKTSALRRGNEKMITGGVYLLQRGGEPAR